MLIRKKVDRLGLYVGSTRYVQQLPRREALNRSEEKYGQFSAAGCDYLAATIIVLVLMNKNHTW